MDLQQYLTLFRKWVWLVIVVVGIAVASSYYYTRQVPPVYQASTTLLVGQALQNPNPNNGEFNVAAQ